MIVEGGGVVGRDDGTNISVARLTDTSTIARRASG